MQFDQFASAHGLIIDHVEYGHWVRVPTIDHPRSRNGAFKHMGEVAFVMNFATMSETAKWFPDSENDIKIDHAAIKRVTEQANRQIAENRDRAEEKAAWIIRQTKMEEHAYLEGKGFKDMLGAVWQRGEQDNILCIPMRVGQHLVGVQMIDSEGTKRFLKGQRTSGAEFVIDNHGIGYRDWYCEGAATGYSLQAVLNALKLRYKIHVCFSANNLTAMARNDARAIIIADNDLSGTGQRAAEDTGRPYLMPATVGQDLNDWHQEIGTFKLSQIIRKLLKEIQS